MTIAQFKESYLHLLEYLEKEISAFKSDSELYKVSGTIINTAGNLSLHLCGNIQNYLGAMLGGTGYIRNRGAEFSRKDFAKTILLDEIKKARDAVIATFNKIIEDDLNKLFPETPYWKGSTTEQVLVICLSHFNYHLGQINYLRRMNEV